MVPIKMDKVWISNDLLAHPEAQNCRSTPIQHFKDTATLNSLPVRSIPLRANARFGSEATEERRSVIWSLSPQATLVGRDSASTSNGNLT